MSEILREIVDVHPVILGEHVNLRREPPRPVEKRQPDYDDRFDFDTLYYDAFPTGDTMTLVGPPLLNLRGAVDAASWTVGGSHDPQVAIQEQDRTQFTTVETSVAAGDPFRVVVDGVPVDGLVSESGQEWFRGRRVLVTKSRNNLLSWIEDWARFHVHEHSVDAVLLYDNDSDAYPAKDVLKALDIPGLDVAVVVNWPFKFGPQGGNWGGLKDAPWDSDFCEYGILEHARRRFLEGAAGVVHHDIDELAVSSGGGTVFDALNASSAGVIRYRGRWIESVSTQAQDTPRFGDFTYFDSRRAPTTFKWAVDPAKAADATQWKTHGIAGVRMEDCSWISHRHFMAITSDWKYARSTSSAFDPAIHRRDDRLVQSLVEVFGADAVADPTAVLSQDALHARLVELRDLIDAPARIPDGLQKVWFWRDDTLVFDYRSSSGVRFAFDVKASDAGISLQITGRDDASWYSVRKHCSTRARPAGPRRLQFTWWAAGTDLDHVGRDIVAHVQWAVGRLSADRRLLPRSIPSYWWDQRTNFGDLIGPWLIQELTARPVHNTIGHPDAGAALMSVGSVLTEMQRPGMVVWGSGLIAPLSKAARKRLVERRPADIRAVRGALTREQLRDGLGWDVPEVYGDPALLMPLVFEPALRPAERSGISLVPHYSHGSLLSEELARSAGMHRVEVQRDAEVVVDEIAQSDVVISTSLHGVILAQAYKIPWVWLRISDQALVGDEFKFEDFFTVLDRSGVSAVSVVADEVDSLDLRAVASRAALPSSRFDTRALLDAFPYEVRSDVGAPTQDVGRLRRLLRALR